jgi:hypothetical protein
MSSFYIKNVTDKEPKGLLPTEAIQIDHNIVDCIVKKEKFDKDSFLSDLKFFFVKGPKRLIARQPIISS